MPERRARYKNPWLVAPLVAASVVGGAYFGSQFGTGDAADPQVFTPQPFNADRYRNADQCPQGSDPAYPASFYQRCRTAVGDGRSETRIKNPGERWYPQGVTLWTVDLMRHHTTPSGPFAVMFQGKTLDDDLNTRTPTWALDQDPSTTGALYVISRSSAGQQTKLLITGPEMAENRDKIVAIKTGLRLSAGVDGMFEVCWKPYSVRAFVRCVAHNGPTRRPSGSGSLTWTPSNYRGDKTNDEWIDHAVSVFTNDADATAHSNAGAPPPPPPPPTDGDPTACFSVTPDPTFNGGATTTFDGSCSQDDGNIARYEWDIVHPGSGDGVYETEGNPASFRFVGSGSKTVTLRVTDNTGATATVRKTFTVNARMLQAASALRPGA